MSSVLWENLLVNGTVPSDEEERRSLFDFTDKLDDRKSLGVPSFADLCDSTEA